MTLVIYSSTFSSSINQRYGDSTIDDNQKTLYNNLFACLDIYNTHKINMPQRLHFYNNLFYYFRLFTVLK